TMAAWDSIPQNQRAFQTRLMEIFASYVEHTDHQVGRLVQGLEERGLRENTLIFYIFGDNGSSSEGQRGSVSELLAQNNIPNTVEQQLKALERIGGIDVLGSAKTDNMYHAGWAWAGGTPFKGTKLMGSYFGGTRNPMVISWPRRIKPDRTVRAQFHHVIDIAPTIYELLDIPHPKVVQGEDQVPMDGTSLVYTFDEGNAAGRKDQQFFDNNASRGIYHEGWFAGTAGPFIPWDTPGSVKRMENWDSAADPWELYDLRRDFSQAKDLAQVQPEKLKEMKQRFLTLAEDNKGFPIGTGLWLRLHPEDRLKTPYTHWTFRQNTRRMPEFTAPGVGRVSTQVDIDVDIGEKASGVLYAVGGASGGLTLYMDKGYLVYEYNMMILEQYIAKSRIPIAAGKHRIEVRTDIPRPGGAGQVRIKVDGKDTAGTALKQTVPGAFTATETFDVGIDLGSPVAASYDKRRPFAFDGKILALEVELK
ncbi:MAG: sulfatase-like hydrolase/transferase, partial [Verrucomicrobiota bacterium]